MTVQEILGSIRFALNDPQGIRFSDYELIDALNSVISNVFNALSSQNSDLIVKSAALTLTNNSANLPSDFLSVYQVEDSQGTPLDYAFKDIVLSDKTYRRLGNKIYSVNSSLTLLYKYFPAKLDDEADVLPLPDYFSDMLQNYVVMIAGKQLNKMEQTLSQMVAADVMKLTANSDYGSLERIPTWKV